MKPDMNPPGAFFNFDAFPFWVYPDLWDETKKVRFRGLWFVILYTLSFSIFSGLILFPGSLIFTNKPLWTTTWVWLYLFTPWGFFLGLAAWWDFTKRSKKLLEEKTEPHD